MIKRKKWEEKMEEKQEVEKCDQNGRKGINKERKQKKKTSEGKDKKKKKTLRKGERRKTKR